MKKILMTIVLLFLTAIISPEPNSTYVGGAEQIIVHKELKGYFKELVKIVNKHNLNVDWSKVDNVDLLPLRRGIQGLWSNTGELAGKGGLVIINYYLTFPPYQKLTKQEKNDFILLVLAHEVGHSQGLEHIGNDEIGLMNPSSRHDLQIIRGMGAEQYIVNTYKNKLKVTSR